MNTTIVLATSSQGKIRELQAALQEYTILPQDHFDVAPCDETGLTFIENAILKARNAAQATGLPAIADDSGLEVAALGGQPGIYSARFAGIDTAERDQANIEKLLHLLQDAQDRRARFYCALVYVRHALDPTPIIGLGQWRGEISHGMHGSSGFGYDPVFYLPELGCTAAELPPTVKQRHSHRRQALDQLIRQMRS